MAFIKLHMGDELHIREIFGGGRGGGGNKKTHVAVYEEGLFDLRGAKLFQGGGGGKFPPPPNPGTFFV